jgi:hypothetical protein
LPGCGGDDDEPQRVACRAEGSLATRGREQIVATIDEWTIELSATGAAPGVVSFIADNVGEKVHQLTLVKAAGAESLPIDPQTGAVDETALPDGAMAGRIEAVDPGQLCRGNFVVEAGRYVLLCNLVAGGDSHFDEGMHAAFEVGR